MTSRTIKDALARKKTQSPQYDYLWRVELPDLTVPSSESIISTDTFGSSFLGSIANVALDMLVDKIDTAGGMQELNHRVTSIDTPYFQMDTKKITDRNTFWYSASNNDIGSINMTIDEMEDGATYNYLNAWKNMIIRDNGTYNPPAMYKRNIKFIRLSATHLDLHVFNYVGYFLNEIQNIQNNYEGNDITQYNCVFTGDGVEYKPVPASMVKTMVHGAETSIILQDWSNDKFRFDGFSGAERVKILSDLSKIFI